MPIHVLCIGAHPDDCEGHIGGTAARLARRGDAVRFLSVTNGDRGHYAAEYIADPSLLAARRALEAKAAVAVIGAEAACLGVRDGEVYVDPPTTEAMIRAIRGFGAPGEGPELVLLNRPNDYHRDHRYTSQLVLDAAYMLTVPTMCPDAPALRRMPVFAYWHDSFVEGGAFRVDVASPIDATLDVKAEMSCAHVSQFFEWLPYNADSHADLANAPKYPSERHRTLREAYAGIARRIAVSCGSALPAGAEFAEAFQISEYGREPEAAELAGLFAVEPVCVVRRGSW